MSKKEEKWTSLKEEKFKGESLKEEKIKRGKV